MLIRDSVAVVTGASRGIGRATALMLGAAGGKVVVNARTRSEALEQVAQTIGGERAEVAPDRVRVVGVAPGLTDTEIVRGGLPNVPERVSRVPLGRMARPEEIAHTVGYAIENDFLTGETVYVTGGE